MICLFFGQWSCVYEQRRWTKDTRVLPDDLTLAKIEDRVLKVCKAYDKITADEVLL